MRELEEVKKQVNEMFVTTYDEPFEEQNLVDFLLNQAAIFERTATALQKRNPSRAYDHLELSHLAQKLSLELIIDHGMMPTKA